MVEKDTGKKRTYSIVFVLVLLLIFITLTDHRDATGNFYFSPYPEQWTILCDDPYGSALDLSNEIENKALCEKACQRLAIGDSVSSLVVGPLAVSFVFDPSCSVEQKLAFNNVCKQVCH